MTSRSDEGALVSVICRTVNRATLGIALDSVASQTHRPLEIILVDATGRGLDTQADHHKDIPLRIVTLSRALDRPQAANAGLDAANGKFILFLDDDDWIGEDHVTGLLNCLSEHKGADVAYSNTLKTRSDGTLLDEHFRFPFDAARLRHDNFIPIHSALVRRSAIGDLRFDESLPIFEDWDFWLQMSSRSQFVHHDAMTAFYRLGGESDTSAEDATARYRPDHPIAQAREQIFNKWLPHWNGAQLNQTFASLDNAADLASLHDEISRLNDDLGHLNREYSNAQRAMQEFNTRINRANQLLSKRAAEVNEALGRAQRLEQERDLVVNSLSWRITRPGRWLRKRVGSLAMRILAIFKDKQAGTEGASSALIQYSLDIPGDIESTFSDSLTVQGWCFAPAGIQQVLVNINGEPHHSFTPDMHRPDIDEHFPGAQDLQPAGFHQEFALDQLQSGQHKFEIVFTDNENNRRSATGVFNLFRGNAFYNDWYWRNTPSPESLTNLRTQSQNSAKFQKFGLLLCVNNRTDNVNAQEMTQSILQTLVSLEEQCFPHWALYLVGLVDEALRNVLTDAITATTNMEFADHLPGALTVAREANNWLLMLEPGDTLTPDALWQMNHVAENHENLQLIYSDHDHSDASAIHQEPVFTPQWSPLHLLCSNYIGGVFALATDCVPDETVDLENPAWRSDILYSRAFTLEQKQTFRIAKVLWSAPTLDAESRAVLTEAELNVVRRKLQAQDAATDVSVIDEQVRRIRWPLRTEPRVSIIIPTTGNLSLVKPCINSIRKLTDYTNYELIILDNSRGKNPEGIAFLRDQADSVIECNEPFNWARLNNKGVRKAAGDMLLFLNDDIEVTDPGWLTELLSVAQSPDVGTVGARLLYPHGALQHAGVMLVGQGGGGIHMLHRKNPGPDIYRQLHNITREVSANTGACLLVSRAKFEEVDGFDEELAVVGNDVDLCLRLSRLGYTNVWHPHATLIHHESISRKTNIPKEDEQAMWRRWKDLFLAGDPYYNPNLCQSQCDFSLRQDSAAIPVHTPQSHTELMARTALPAKPGVNLIGYLRAEMGIGEGARSDARALDAAGEPFGIINFESGNPARMTDLSWQHRETDEAIYDINILHINPDHAAQAVAELPDDVFQGRYTIGYWAWELPEIPEDWEACFQYVDEVWVPSRFVHGAVAMRSPVPVNILPHAIEVTAVSDFNREHFGLPEDAFVFLCMFDIHSRPERKNPYGAVHAFQQAFERSNMQVRLVIKINNVTPQGLQALRSHTAGWNNIILLDEVYSRADINALIACSDCFVSLHRSEGFGLGPAEAMSLGKATILTNWSGNTDYMTAENSLGVGYRLVTLEEDYGPYKKGQHWAEPDIKQASRFMQELAGDPVRAVAMGEHARATIEQYFSPQAVGKLMRKRLAAIRKLHKS